MNNLISQYCFSISNESLKERLTSYEAGSQLHSPKSAILTSAISNFGNPLPIGSSDWQHFFMAIARLEKKNHITVT